MFSLHGESYFFKFPCTWYDKGEASSGHLGHVSPASLVGFSGSWHCKCLNFVLHLTPFSAVGSCSAHLPVRAVTQRWGKCSTVQSRFWRIIWHSRGEAYKYFVAWRNGEFREGGEICARAWIYLCWLNFLLGGEVCRKVCSHFDSLIHAGETFIGSWGFCMRGNLWENVWWEICLGSFFAKG